VQGPTELLPISSSSHLALVPRLLGWPAADLPPEVRKSLEVALHAGSAAALVLVIAAERPQPSPEELLLALVSTAPAAVAALALERPIERRLGTDFTVALAQLGGGAALIAADRGPASRPWASPSDWLVAGLAQAAALVPGVSRGGAVLIAARMRGLDRRAALRLSTRTGVPVAVGAAGLKTLRALRGELPVRLAPPLAAGAAAAFATTLAAAPLARRLERARSLAPLGLYRLALGALLLGRR
jgi:undecaprenyl-diphosphatase